ncbi:MAG: hypothetical protein H7Y01_14055 [Ferruginibacter sp.]|nr:hypothetical protein [Chitinophagaceae bacterium]
MKKSLMKGLLTKCLTGGIFACMFLLVSFSPATTDSVSAENISASIQVKYLGGDNEALFFKVKYDNKAGNKFKLLALDESGAAVFQDNFSAKDFEKKIKIPRLTETDYVIFLFKSPKENVELSYKVKVTTKVVDNAMLVKKR